MAIHIPWDKTDDWQAVKQFAADQGITIGAVNPNLFQDDEYKFGSVGQVFPGSEVKLGEGDEIMIKGPGIMDGYHNLPEETHGALTDDGWLRTGDKGRVDEDGFLFITGRIKDLFKTSGGKYIAPSAIESKFKAICPYASQFLVFGNERNYCVALVTLDPDAIAGWAEENGMGGKSYTEVVQSPEVQKMVGGYVDELNSHIGVALASGVDAEVARILRRIQNELFHMGAELSVREEDRERVPGPRVDERHVEALERAIDRLGEELGPLENFILPDGSPASAHLHVARTVCRRAERLLVRLARDEAVGPQTIRYLNRLSDALFMMARLENKRRGVPESLWDSRA